MWFIEMFTLTIKNLMIAQKLKFEIIYYISEYFIIYFVIEFS